MGATPHLVAALYNTHQVHEPGHSAHCRGHECTTMRRGVWGEHYLARSSVDDDGGRKRLERDKELTGNTKLKGTCESEPDVSDSVPPLH
jgi:hypothetical protein